VHLIGRAHGLLNAYSRHYMCRELLSQITDICVSMPTTMTRMAASINHGGKAIAATVRRMTEAPLQCTRSKTGAVYWCAASEVSVHSIARLVALLEDV
jgi:hypothetical protein